SGRCFPLAHPQPAEHSPLFTEKMLYLQPPMWQIIRSHVSRTRWHVREEGVGPRASGAVRSNRLEVFSTVLPRNMGRVKAEQRLVCLGHRTYVARQHGEKRARVSDTTRAAFRLGLGALGDPFPGILTGMK
ncbi:MAG: hypothetical protein P8182_20210, partial [Deltaproteobacteria bacterium]